jgi:stringent starvation protein B
VTRQANNPPGPPRKLPPKKEVCLALLEGPSVFLHIDPRKEGVAVPPWFKKQPQLVLQVGLNMAIPIPDLRVEDEGVTCTLSFNRSPFWCKLPWDAIYALVGEDGRGMIWPNDVPPEVASQMQKATQPEAPTLSPVGAAAKPEPAVTPVPPPAAAAPAGKTKKPRAPREKKPRGGQAAGVPVEAPKAARVEEAPPPPPVETPSSPRKPKRELPPYLRVIK